LRYASRWSIVLMAAAPLLATAPALAANPQALHFTNQAGSYAHVTEPYVGFNQCIGPGQSRDLTLPPSVQYHFSVDSANDAGCAQLIAGSNARWDANPVSGTLRLTYSRRYALDQTSPAPAQGSVNPGACGVLRTINATQNRVWVTVYDAAQIRHLDYGWVEPCAMRDWRAGTYLCGSYYHARAEVKDANLSATLYDTRVQVRPNINSSDNIVVLKHGATNYYWDHGNVSYLGTFTGSTIPRGCEAPSAARSPMKSVTLHFTNKQATPVRVQAIYGWFSGSAIDNQCVGPNQTRDFKMFWDFQYYVTADAANDANCSQLTSGSSATASTYGTVGAETVNMSYSYRYAIDPK